MSDQHNKGKDSEGHNSAHDGPLEAYVQNTTSLHEWQHYFVERFKQFEKRKMQAVTFRDLADGNGQNYSFVHIHREYYPALINSGQFFDEEVALLYRFHAQLETLLRLFHFESAYGIPSFLESNFEVTVKRMAESMYETLKNMNTSYLFSSYFSLVEESLQVFQSIYEIPPKWSNLLFYLFQVGWATLYDHDQWVNSYESQLSKEKEEGASSQMLDLALVHFAFIQHKHIEAFERLRHSKEKAEAEQLVVWLSILYNKEDWDGLLQWLLYLKPHFLLIVKNYYFQADAREFFHQYLHFFWKYAQHTGEEENYEEMLVEFLPITFYEYSEFLLVQGDIERWIELQIMMGYSPELIQRRDLKEVLQMDKRAALPLYHQAVDRFLQERTRKSYQSAIKHLKELRSIYEDIGESESFLAYVKKLAAETIRLRAFQEELKKGKFIS